MQKQRKLKVKQGVKTESVNKGKTFISPQGLSIILWFHISRVVFLMLKCLPDAATQDDQTVTMT